MNDRTELQARLDKAVSDGAPESEVAGLRTQLEALGGGWGAVNAPEAAADERVSAANSRIDRAVAKKRR